MTVIIIFTVKCEDKHNPCWECTIITTFYNPPAVLDTTYVICDFADERGARFYEKINTYKDMTLTQTCTCKEQ